MEPADRLAAFLAGELHADERADLEAALARDPELRRLLDAMQRADRAVAELRSPRPPAGFDERLDRRLDEVLAETLPSAAITDDDATRAPWQTGAGDPVAAGDELAARRARRRPSAGVLGAVAAGVVLLAGGVVIGQLGDGMGGDDDASEEAETDSMADAPEQETATEEEMSGDLDAGPAVVASDRSVDDDDLDALLESDELTRLADQRLDSTSGGDLARDYQGQLGVGAPAGTDDSVADTDESADDSGAAAGDGTAEDTDAAEDADEDRPEEDMPEEDAEAETGERPASDEEPSLSPQQLPEILTRDGQPLDDAVARDLARCLDEVLAAQPDAIPVYAELLTFEDRDAVAFGLLTRQTDTGAFTRREVWALDLATCQTLRFSQSGDDGR